MKRRRRPQLPLQHQPRRIRPSRLSVYLLFILPFFSCFFLFDCFICAGHFLFIVERMHRNSSRWESRKTCLLFSHGRRCTDIRPPPERLVQAAWLGLLRTWPLYEAEFFFCLFVLIVCFLVLGDDVGHSFSLH